MHLQTKKLLQMELAELVHEMTEKIQYQRLKQIHFSLQTTLLNLKTLHYKRYF